MKLEKNWDLFLLPYQQAVDELKIKLKGQRQMFRLKEEPSPIEFVTGRLKPVNSIIAKSKTRLISLNKLDTDMEDIAGIRIMCPFVEDIREVVEMLRKRPDLTIVSEKDYITNKKESGYRSYHLVCKYPVQIVNEEVKVLVEIQVRTLAMNFWASIEHSLNYKYQGEYPEEINRRLKITAEQAFKLDEEMSKIREEIKETREDIDFNPDSDFEEDPNKDKNGN